MVPLRSERCPLKERLLYMFIQLTLANVVTLALAVMIEPTSNAAILLRNRSLILQPNIHAVASHVRQWSLSHKVIHKTVKWKTGWVGTTFAVLTFSLVVGGL